MRLFGIAVLAALTFSTVGCGSWTLLDDSLTLELRSDAAPIARSLKRDAAGQMIRRLEAVESQTDETLNPNNRAGANCVGGVCVIF